MMLVGDKLLKLSSPCQIQPHGLEYYSEGDEGGLFFKSSRRWTSSL